MHPGLCIISWDVENKVDVVIKLNSYDIRVVIPESETLKIKRPYTQS
jgi:hypothetical protein